MNFPATTKFRKASFSYTFVILALLFLAAWLPRMLQLDTFVTTDERRWLTRSANYYTAITRNDLHNTIQTDHPGVTVMWAGTLGFLKDYPAYAEESPGQVYYDRFEVWINENTEHRLLDLLVAGRWWMVLVISVFLTLSFLPLRVLFDAKLAIVGVLFMAWDPFHIALSRFLHLDGLLTAFLVFSFLTFMAWLFGQRQARYLVISGVAFGLATLTKLPAVFLAPTVGLLALLAIYYNHKKGDSQAKPVLLGVVVWGGIAVGVFALLWPALWLDPIGVITQLITGAQTYAAGHTLPNFFMGKITNDPGPFFYPVSYLFRTTPITLVGLIMAFIMVARKRWPLDTEDRRLTVIGLLIFTVIFTLGLMTAAKKFDRYLLPIYLPLDIVAALGWTAIARFGLGWWRRRRASAETLGNSQAAYTTPSPVFVFLVGLAALQGLFAFNQFPYYLTYYNPMVGGIQKAEEVLMVGWGEGLDLAAEWVNEQEGAAQSQVVSWYGAGPFSYYLNNKQFPLWYWDPDFWFEADYAVTYINQWQREIPDRETIAFFDNLEPVHSISLNGLEVARIYDMRHLPPPEFTHISTASAGHCSDVFALSAHQQDRDSLLPGESTQLTLFLKTLSPIEEDYRLLARLEGDNDVSIWQSEQEIGIPADLLSLIQIEHVELDITIPSDAAAGEYELFIACSELEKSSDMSDTFIAVTNLRVLPVTEVDLEATWGEYGLETLRHQPRVQQGQPLNLALSAWGRIDGSTKISVRLVDRNGEKIAQQDKTFEREMDFVLDIHPDLTPDRYDIAVIIYDPETLSPIPDVVGNEIILLSSVDVLAP